MSYFPRHLTCLSPVFIAEFRDASETAFEKVLSKLINCKIIAPTVVDKAKSEYQKFVTRTGKERKSDFLNFGKKVQQLDQFLISCISGTKGFTELSKVFRVLLILSHGQAQVERGFSTNAELLLENQNTKKHVHLLSFLSKMVIHYIKHIVNSKFLFFCFKVYILLDG